MMMRYDMNEMRDMDLMHNDGVYCDADSFVADDSDSVRVLCMYCSYYYYYNYSFDLSYYCCRTVLSFAAASHHCCNFGHLSVSHCCRRRGTSLRK